jgi:acetylornithine deacetylase/succinyl-diaminopimelate desuccinylase-like protein
MTGSTTDLSDVLLLIDKHSDQFIQRLQRLCRQPSITAQGIGIEPTAHMVADMMASVGIDTEILPTGGSPAVVGELAGPAGSPTLLFYNHYDVIPPEPLEKWTYAPFGAEVHDGRLYARGAADNKGNLVARLCAVEAWQQVYGSLPLTVKFLVEGEEEVGSIHLGSFVEEHRERLEADGCLWETAYKDPQGRLWITLGVKGVLSVELGLQSLRQDLHSAEAAIAPSAPWRLLWAVNSLKGPDERIRIPGFYDAVRTSTSAELDLLDKWPFDESALLRHWEAETFLMRLGDRALKERYLFSPTCNICGFAAGYTGEGSKTVLPCRAMVKLDFRLVPDQDPDKVLNQLRDHLDRQGFDDIAIEVLGSEPPARTNPADPLVKATVAAARGVYQESPVVLPTMIGSGPMYEVCQKWGIPAVGAGVGYYDSRHHAPNENIRLVDFIEGIKHVAILMDEFASARS